MKKIPRRLQRAANRLVDLLDKAVMEGEKNVYITISHKHITRYANNQFYGYDIRINVGYVHKGEKNEVVAYKVISKSLHYNPALRVREVIRKAEDRGLAVLAIRGVNLGDSSPDGTTNP